VRRSTSRLMGVRPGANLAHPALGEQKVRVPRGPFPDSRRQHMVHMMRRPSRLAGLLATLFLATLVLVTSGFACIAPANARAMDAMGMVSGQTNSQATAETPAPVQDTRSAPCKFPWAPDGCQSMVPCAPAAVAASPTSLGDRSPAPDRVSPDIALVPSSITSAPELPPPRA
jgi:hypothetical protein